MKIASQVADMGIPVIGVPKTIDNDLVNTIVTFGFDRRSILRWNAVAIA